jgi:tetratricopeptide (TPR) repeat protein
MYDTRVRQPYRKKSASKGGALIFGLGLGALLATVAIVIGIAIPNIGARLQYLPYYARTYYRKIVPHPEYLPTPAPTVSAGAVAPNVGPVRLDLPSVSDNPSTEQVIPVAISVESDVASSPTTNISVEENLLLPQAQVGSGIAAQPAGQQAQLTGFTHQWQTWNNCGPATITTNMSYFGRSETQVDAAQFLKPNADDKNVSPYELAAYARSVGLGATLRQGGSVEQLKRFLNNDFPVLTETWLIHDGDGLGHYRLITGYDDAANEFVTHDSLNGPDRRVSYQQFDSDWRVFNRLYLIIYPPEQAGAVSAIVGKDIADAVMYERLVAEAQAEIAANPNDAIAYFNLGEARARSGRYDEAVLAFDQARRLGLHWRRLWYQFTPFEAYYATGRYQDVLDLAEATLAGTGGLEEAYYYQGLALHATGQGGAKEAFEAALEYNSNFTLAQNALDTLAAN